MATAKTKQKKRKKKSNPASKLAQAIAPGQSLAKYCGGDLALHLPGEMTPTQLTLFPDLSFKEASQALFKVAQMRDGGSWWTGDVLNYMQSRWGEEYAQAASESGLSEDTLSVLQRVSARVPPENRKPELSWSHHRVISSLPAEDQPPVVAMCIEHAWTVRELAEYLRSLKPSKEGEDEGDEGDEGEGGGDEEAKESKSCECCGDPKGTMKVCGKCAHVAAKALDVLGEEGAVELIKSRPSKPQIAMLEWALKYIVEPEILEDEELKAWHKSYKALQKIVKG